MQKISIHPKLFLSITLLLVTLLTAHCGRGDEALTAQSVQPAELLWMTLDVNSQVEQTLANNYQEEHTEITFNRQPLAWGGDFISDSSPPDMLMSFVNRQYAQASRQGELSDLSEVWTNATLDENLLPNVQKLIRDEENGNPLMVPIAFAWSGIYYNKAIFAQYNLQPPQNWNEFIQVCATLQANGETPLAIPGLRSYAHTLWFDYLNLRINGAAYHRSLLAGQERYDDPRIISLLETWRSLIDQGFVVERPELMDDLAAINALVRGDNGAFTGEEAVMVLMDSYIVSRTPPEFRHEFDFFRFPVIDPSVPLAEPVDVIGYVIPANAPHRVQAQDFLSYLGLPEAQALIAREAGNINGVYAPVRADLEAGAVTAEMDKAMRMIQETDEVVPFASQWMPSAMWEEFNPAAQRLLRDEYNFQGFMDTLETARQSAIEQGVFPQSE